MLTAIGRLRLSDFLSSREVVTSSELAGRLCARGGVSEVYARKILTRQAGENGVWRSERLKLQQNERLFAHRQFVGTAPFFAQAAALLETLRPGVARCLKRLADGLVIHRAQATKLLAAPLEADERARRPAVQADLDALEELGVVPYRPTPDFECFVTAGGAADSSRLDDLANQARRSLRTELLLARILGTYLRRMNVISWDRLQVAAPETGYWPVNNQAFTALGFSYLDPVAEWKTSRKPTGCPVLIDVLTDRCTSADLASFRDRLMKATHRGGGRQRSLGIVAARDFEPAALKEARGRGFITVNFRQLYGDQALEALQTVSQLLALTNDPTDGDDVGVPAFADLLKELKANPVVVQIRSIAFEVVAGLVLQEKHACHPIRLGLRVPFEDKLRGVQTWRDVDAHGARADHLWVVECKANHVSKEVDFSDVKKFYAETLPALLAHHRANVGKVRECDAEFWTTGRFQPDCQAQLDALLPSVRYGCKMRARLLDGDQVRDDVPSAVARRCGDLLKAISLHEAPPDEE